MEEYFVRRHSKRPPTHPGEILREDVLPSLGLSESEAAKRLGMQQEYDLWHTEQRMRNELSKIETVVSSNLGESFAYR